MINLAEKGLIERQLFNSGLRIAGIDEVGRGCLAGPVVAACVFLDYEKLERLDSKTKMLIRDSKTLSAKQRDQQMSKLESISIDWKVAEASVSEIEEVGILNATFLAMNRAVAKMSHQVELLLVDGHLPIRGQSLPQRPIIKGDSLCYAIAAASIVAKQHRDEIMRKQSMLYPEYGFAQNVGYGTAQHLYALKNSGICPLHRRNFAPVRDLVGS